MKNKKRQIYSLGSLLAVAGPVFAAQACAVGNAVQEEKYEINGKSLNKRGVIQYIKSFSKTEFSKNENESERTWVIDTAFGKEVFNNPYELRKKLIENIIEKFATVIPLSNSDDGESEKEFNELFANQVIIAETKDELSNSLIEIYQGKDDYAFFGSGSSKIDAKKSFMQFHNAYLFNNIYFKNKEDLEVYLNRTMQIKKTTELDKIRRYEFNFPLSQDENQAPQNFKVLTIPKNIDGTLNFIKLKETIAKLIEANSEKTISFIGSDGERKIIKLSELNSSNMNELLKFLKSWNIGTDRSSSHYVIDTEKDSRGTLFGGYFVKLPFSPGAEKDSSGIMALDGDNTSWKKLGSKPSGMDMVQSDPSIENKLGSLMSLVFSSITKANQTKDQAPSFLDIFTKKKLDIFISYLNDIDLTRSEYDDIGNELITIDSNLRLGKKYNLFYSLPILRNWLISRLIDGRASQVDLDKVNNVFVRGAAYLNIVVNKLLEPFLKETGKSIDFNVIYGFNDTSQNIYASPQTSIQEIMKDGIIKDAISALTLTSSYLIRTLAENFNDWTKNPEAKRYYDQPNIQNNDNRPIPKFKMLSEYHLPENESQRHGHDVFKNFKFASKSSIFKKNMFNYFKSINNGHKDVNKKIEYYNKDFLDKGYDPFSNLSDFAPSKKNSAPNKISNNDDYLSDISQIIIGEIDAQGIKNSNHDIVKLMKNLSLISEGYIKNGQTIFNLGAGVVNEKNDFGNFLLQTEWVSKLSEITNQTFKLIEKVQKVFPKIALNLAKIVPKLFKAAPYVQIVILAVDIIKGVIDFFSKEYITEYYVHNGSEVKHLWNGGEREEQFWGLSKITNHGIDKLKLLNPVQLTATSKSVKPIYFDGKLYDTKIEALIDAINKLKNNLSQEVISSFFTEDVKLGNSFNNIVWTTEDEKEALADALVRKTLINKNVNAPLEKIDYKKDLDKNSIYLKSMFKTSHGLTYNSTKAVKTIIKDILADIKPIFIFQKPQVIENKLKILPFSLPYPSYVIGSGVVDGEESKREASSLQYIYNPNIDSKYKQEVLTNSPTSNILESSREIIDFYLNKLIKEFNVNSKKVYKLEALSKDKYSELLNNYKQVIIFLAKSPLGKRKYFKTRTSAIEWLKPEFNLRTVIPGIVFKKYLWKGFENDQNIEFETQSKLIKYVLDKYNLGAIYD